MGLRGRLTLLAAGAVGLTVVLASVVCYLVMRHELRDQVDDALGRQGGLVVRAAPEPVITDLRDRFTVQIPAPPPRAGGSAPYVQMLDAAGKVVRRGRRRAAGDPGHRARRARRGGQGARPTSTTARSTATTCV